MNLIRYLISIGAWLLLLFIIFRPWPDVAGVVVIICCGLWLVFYGAVWLAFGPARAGVEKARTKGALIFWLCMTIVCAYIYSMFLTVAVSLLGGLYFEHLDIDLLKFGGHMAGLPFVLTAAFVPLLRKVK